MRIIAIANQKGGCGKTTTAINLAASLSINNKKVLLIDLDPQSHASLGLNIQPKTSIYNVLSRLTTKKARLDEIIINIAPNFDLAPSSILLSTLEQELTGEIGRESRLFDTVNSFKALSNYDYVLLDCPPNLGILTINAIRASSEIIITVEASRFSLDGVSRLLDIVNLVKDRLNHQVSHQVLVTMFDSRLRHSFTMLDEIKKVFKNTVFDTIIHVNVKLKEAQNAGSHILNFDKYSRGAKDYFSLAREIITKNDKASTKTTTQAAPVINLEKHIKAVLKEELPKVNDAMFSIFAPDAKEVFVVGDFNSWKPDTAFRMDTKDGIWSKKLNLKSGRYQYKFIVDGKWIEDPGNPAKEKNPFGALNSLLEIK